VELGAGPQVPLDRGADFGRAHQEELVALALNCEPERRVLEQILVRGFEALARHPDGAAELHDRGALPGGCP
jgi:hypothetical protein